MRLQKKSNILKNILLSPTISMVSHLIKSKYGSYQTSLKKLFLIFIVLALIKCHHECVHDQMIEQTQKHYYNDLHEGRLLQNATIGPIRIFADYSQLTVGGATQKNVIKRIVNITASYFYKTLKVQRLNRLYFPNNLLTTCNTLTVPSKYVTEGAAGDVGFIVGNENSPSAVYTAKSAACAFLQSNKRSIWGVMIFNNAFLKYDLYGFQQILFVGIHEATHILGFSAQMYSTFTAGNPLKNITNGDYSDYYLDTPAIRRQVKNQFNCSTFGLLLEDQDGTLISSHVERNIAGNQYMTAVGKKNSWISRLTLSVLESTGWYPEVNYSMAQPTTWGKNKGCGIFNVDDCNYPQFCQGSSFDCQWDLTSIGKCQPDALTGTCQTVKYYTNTICIDQNFQLRNLNVQLNAMERGGEYSRCFSSTYRQLGKTLTTLNNRCYISVCSDSGKYIFILVGSYVLICRVPGQVLTAPAGMEGTLTCPGYFQNICQNKKTCPYHCNKNGACINGQCLCTGQKQLSSTCIDVALTTQQVGDVGGFDLEASSTSSGSLLYSKVDGSTLLINNKCFAGYVFDSSFGQCQQCSQLFGCKNCNQNGCISCDNGVSVPINGKC